MSKVEWRCPYRVYYQFQEYWDILQALDPRTDDAKGLVSAIRSLPGYPNDYDEDRDEIVVVPYKERLT